MKWAFSLSKEQINQHIITLLFRCDLAAHYYLFSAVSVDIKKSYLNVF